MFWKSDFDLALRIENNKKTMKHLESLENRVGLRLGCLLFAFAFPPLLLGMREYWDADKRKREYHSCIRNIDKDVKRLIKRGWLNHQQYLLSPGGHLLETYNHNRLCQFSDQTASAA